MRNPFRRMTTEEMARRTDRRLAQIDADMLALTEARGSLVEKRNLVGVTTMGGGGFIGDPSAIPPFPGYGSQIAGIPVTAQSAMQVPAVFAAIRTICFTFGRLGNPYAATVELSDDNEPYYVRQPQQPMILTDTFGGTVGGIFNYDGWNRTIASMALFGESWWYVIDAPRSVNNPNAVEVLNPLWLEIKDDENGNREYLYGIGGKQVPLDPAKLRHTPLLADAGGVRGLSSIKYLGVMMGLALASLEFGSAFFSQGQSPSYILSTEQKVTKDNADALVQRFLVQHAGLSQAHLPLLLDQGLKADRVLATPDESQFVGTLTAAYEAIGGYFGVPPYLMGVMTEKGNAYGIGATEELMRRFHMTCLVGYITAVEEALTRMLPDGVYAKFDQSKLVSPDAQAMAMYFQSLRQGQFITQNEGRIKLGYAPKPGGDELTQPLASNTAPEQTSGDSKPDTKPPAKDETEDGDAS